jgi:hypothetical protein
MAGQSSQPKEPFTKTNDFKIALVVGLILAIVGGGIALFNTVITTDDPSSDDATLILDETPSSISEDTELRFSGAGWNGDNTVIVAYPGALVPRESVRIPVENGRFTGAVHVRVKSGQTYKITAIGEQSRHEVNEFFRSL